MTANTLMVVGTSSSAGKSLLVAGLCRLYARQGIRVAPFKAQNMSNNAGVCADGSEIGRAQITQAFAAGIEPTPQMNPVLLKPESNMRSQVIVMGRPFESLSARNYFERKQKLWGYVTTALDELRQAYDLVIIEGAGSPAELNLKKNDIVNMAVARYANASTLIVGDIDRGGIFAQLLGTYWLLPPEEQQLITGFVVNKFRGDRSLFDDGVDILEEKSGKPVVGVLPWLPNLYIPEEDGVALDNLSPETNQAAANKLDIAVIKLPRISNFDDFDPLMADPRVRVRYVSSPEALGQPAAVIIPGTKSTISDLQWLKGAGFGPAIRSLAERGAAIVGICGGYQMLGSDVYDPNLVEASDPHEQGLGLLPIQTTFEGIKSTHQASAEINGGGPGWLGTLGESNISGYEIHMGQTITPSPWLTIEQRGDQTVSVLDGAISANGQIWGCYMHGLFNNSNLRQAWLNALVPHSGFLKQEEQTHTERLNASLDRLADEIELVFGPEWIKTLSAGAIDHERL